MLLAHLPAPTREYAAAEHNIKELPPANKSLQLAAAAQKSAIPPYGSYERALYRPRRQDDYGDGGEVLGPRKTSSAEALHDSSVAKCCWLQLRKCTRAFKLPVNSQLSLGSLLSRVAPFGRAQHDSDLRSDHG